MKKLKLIKKSEKIKTCKKNIYIKINLQLV